MNPNTMDENNLVRGSDSTAEIIRKHAIYKKEMKRISENKIKRGQDYWGGYDDSIANDLTECEEILYERAVMHHDSEAVRYIMENEVNGLYWIWQKLNRAKAAFEALSAENIKSEDIVLGLTLLKTIIPDDYPSAEDDDEEGEEQS